MALVRAERQRMLDLQQYLTAETAMALVGAVSAIVRRHVSDRSALAAISTDIARLNGPAEAAATP